MLVSEIKEKFISFFEGKGHVVVPSSSLVPENDPTVLFTTAGMQQFKRFYAFPDEARAPRVVSVQKCVRTGDIDEVGDETHLTYFEMLGNFSFGFTETGHSNSPESDANQHANDSGPYFKKEAIIWAWEFLTQTLGIEKSRIYATYFKDDAGAVPEDIESLNILKNIDGLAEIKPQGFDDNFWSLGTEGAPGGPTVEFYVDGIEIWNLVFNEYVLRDGKYEPSKVKGVDTGMGLERLATVLQGVHDVYQIDTFKPIIKEIEEITGLEYGSESDSKYEECWVETRKKMRVIADHIKASVYLTNDGVEPSNKDRGYILRRLIRRAIVKAQQIGVEKDFCADVSSVVISTDDASVGTEKSLSDSYGMVSAVFKSEEEKFRKTLASGLRIFEKTVGIGSAPIGSFRIGREYNSLTGEDIFNLYQTYGFPMELSFEIAKEKSVSFAEDAKKKALELLTQHQQLSRTASARMFKGGLADNKPETTRLHTAAHLLLAALRHELGNEVEQKGSNITEERLRFDFNYPEKLTEDQIKKIEDLVNLKIEEALPITMQEMDIDSAKKSGAVGSFAHKYGDVVKIYTIGALEDPYSHEICGGPHVKNTSELGYFKIIKEESSSSGVRRIKAVLE